MFGEMIERIQRNTIEHLLRIRFRIVQQPQQREQPPAAARVFPTPAQTENAPQSAPVPRVFPSAPARPAETPSAPLANGGNVAPGAGVPKQIDLRELRTNGTEKFNPATMKKEKKPGPNDPCPCGSGLKYKKCHGKPF